MTTTLAPTYRRTRRGERVVFGPADVIRPGHSVTVHLEDGTVALERPVGVGRPFRAGGQSVVYGYLGRARPPIVEPEECLGCGSPILASDRTHPAWPGRHFRCAQ